MTRKDANKLIPGLYLVFWKDGLKSLAAIGRAKGGGTWLAPTDWDYINTLGIYWKDVESVKLIAMEVNDAI